MGRWVLETALSSDEAEGDSVLRGRPSGHIRFSISILKSSYLPRKVNKFCQLKNLKRHLLTHTAFPTAAQQPQKPRADPGFPPVSRETASAAPHHRQQGTTQFAMQSAPLSDRAGLIGWDGRQQVSTEGCCVPMWSPQ